MINQKHQETQAYVVDASDLAKNYNTNADCLVKLADAVDKAASIRYEREAEKGKKTTKKDSVEKILSEIGLGSISSHLHMDPYTAQEARKYVLKTLIK
jgi:hypothetical protein